MFNFFLIPYAMSAIWLVIALLIAMPEAILPIEWFAIEYESIDIFLLFMNKRLHWILPAAVIADILLLFVAFGFYRDDLNFSSMWESGWIRLGVIISVLLFLLIIIMVGMVASSVDGITHQGREALLILTCSFLFVVKGVSFTRPPNKEKV